MAVITFVRIRERVAAHQRQEAIRNAPEAVARRAVFELNSALADLGAAIGAGLATVTPAVAAEPAPTQDHAEQLLIPFE